MPGDAGQLREGGFGCRPMSHLPNIDSARKGRGAGLRAGLDDDGLGRPVAHCAVTPSTSLERARDVPAVAASIRGAPTARGRP